MKKLNSIAALALYALSVTLVATADNANAGDEASNTMANIAASDGSFDMAAAPLMKVGPVDGLSGDSPFTRSIIERAQTAFAAQLALDCGPDTQMEWVAEDAVYQYALSGIDVNLRMEGRTVVAEHLCAMSDFAPEAIAQNIHYFPTLMPDLVYVQYDLVPTDGTSERSRPLAIIQMRADQIVKFTQLSRSPESLKVLTASL
jgi:hypothetical protein